MLFRSRVWLLHRYGGLDLDGDMYTLRNMDDLRPYVHFAAHRMHGTFNNAVLGSAPGSKAFAHLLGEIRALHQKHASPPKRPAYGPDLLSRTYKNVPGLLNVLPAHYFYIFQTHGTAIRFIHSTAEQQKQALDSVRNRISDGVEPYAVHTWGIPRKNLPRCYHAERSSGVNPVEMGDRKSTRLNSSHPRLSRMPSSA